MPDPVVPPPKTIASLLSRPFLAQTKVLLRSLRTHPLRALDWVDYWRSRPDQATASLQGLPPPDRALLAPLFDLYQAATGNPPFLSADSRPPMRSVSELFASLRELTMVVGEKHANSLMVRGAGGTGKTYTVQETLKTARIPFEVLRGYSTPVALYNTLYANRTALVVVDDCDDVFSDLTGLNILKAVLDSYPIRTVSWNSMGNAAAVLQFNFEGQVIFVSNMSLAKLSTHMQALMTRILVLHMDLTVEQILQYLGLIRKTPYKATSESERYRVFAFLREHQAEIPNLNFRHYTKALDLLASGRNWRRLFMATL